jgi:hypothetical protein
MKLETKFLLLYAVSSATLIAIGQTPKHIGLGLTLLTIGAIYAFTLQSKRFREWLGQFF